MGVTGYDIYKDGSLLVSTTNTTYNVTGLTASTSYTFYVKAKDEAGNVSNASNTVNVTTSDMILSYCTSQGNNSSYEWIASVEIDSYTNSSGSANYTDFTSEIITLEKGTNVNISLTPGFSGSTYNEYWKIWIDYNGDKDFDDVNELVFDAGSLNSGVVSGNISIPATASGTTRMRVSMKYNAAQTACETFSYGEVEDYTVTFTDAVMDTEAPTAPSSIAASNITTSSLTLSWNASSDNVGVTEYEVYQDGSYMGSSSTTSYDVSELASSSTYTFAVRAKDAAGNTSALSNSINVTTSALVISYCNSYGLNTSDEWINGIVIADLSNTSGNNGGYADYTHMTANLSAGSTYNIILYTGYSGRAYKEVYAIWIDYNQDGEFDESTELAFTGETRYSSFTGSLTVPADALSGTTRMRVSMKYNKVATPCEVFTYGEVEDYTVNISSGKSTIALSSVNPININVKAKIYPNPANGITTLELLSDDMTSVSYKLIDLQGRTILAKDDIQVNGYQEEKIDVQSMKSGIYFMMIYNNEISESYKLIVE